MSVVWAICRRDLLAQFTTPLAWLVLAVWTLLTNGVFWFNLWLVHVDPDGYRTVPLYVLSLAVGGWALTGLAPALTMNSFSSERVQGTMQLLLTAPITELQLLLGKFGAAALILLALVAATLVQPAVLWFVSDTGGLQLVAGYLGLVLCCLLFAALGIWISLLVDSPVAAYVLTMGAILALYLVSLLADPYAGAWEPLAAVGRFLGLDARLRPLRQGEVRLQDVAWFLSLAGIFLALAHGALCARRIRG